jgi:nucleoside-diphosphate-sugar epimerase
MSVKTYGYVENVTYQINQILLSEKSIQKVYYLGDYDSYSIKEWANEIGKIFGNKITTIPRALIYILAIFGDILGYFKINFPMSSFRYKNMTTDNKLSLENLKQIAPNLPFTRQEGNIKTIQWMKENGYIDNI